MEPKKSLSRRHFLQYLGAGAVSLATAYTGLTSLTPKAAASTSEADPYTQLPATFNPTLHTAADADQLLLANGFTYNVIAAFGDTINNLGDTLGFNSSYTSFFPIAGSSTEAMLWVNHDSVQYPWLTDRSKPIAWEQQKLMLYGQGGSSLHIRKDAFGYWKLVPDSELAHRISGLTPIELSGPVAGSKAVNGATLVQGTFANRGGGKTLWNTQLIGENHFESTCRDAGLAPTHYGWVVEVDPLNAKNKPIKHTALGRFNHGSTAMTLSSDNRIIVYMGEDSSNGFIYKFVSKAKWSQDIAALPLMSEGTLYAADLIHGRWIEISLDNVKKQLKSLTYQVPEALAKSKETLLKQFQSQSDVLTYAREAATIIGATPCDKPAELTVHPVHKSLFVAFTQNTSRANLHGQIVRLTEASGLTFEFETFITGGRQSGFSSPSSLTFDKKGNLWVSSDIAAEQLNTGAWSEFKNNGLYLIHPTGTAKKTKQYASAPIEAAVSGISFTDNQDTVFLAINHPGSLGAGTNKPTSHWQTSFGDNNPRSAVVVVSNSQG